MKVLVDMNLSPDWCRLLGTQGWEAVHWSEVGSPTATDRDVMAYAAQGKYVVFAQGESEAAILAELPGLEQEDIRASLAYVRAVIADDRGHGCGIKRVSRPRSISASPTSLSGSRRAPILRH